LRNKGIRPDNYTFNQLLIASAANGSVKQAFSTYNDMKKYAVRPTVFTFNILINALANAQSGTFAQSDLNLMKIH